MTFADFRRVQDMQTDWSEPLAFVWSQKWSVARFRAYHLGVLLRRFFSAHPTYIGQALTEQEWVRVIARRVLPTDPPIENLERLVADFLQRKKPNVADCDWEPEQNTPAAAFRTLWALIRSITS